MAERAVATAKAPEAKQKCSNSCKQNVGFNSSGPTTDMILQLQRTAGNRAVQKLIKSGALQAKLRIGQPNDVYEQEADKVAEQVMRMPEPVIQMQNKPDEEEEKPIQAKPVADQITPLVQRQAEEEEEESVQTKLITPEVMPQLKRQPEEEEEEKEEPLQTKEISGQNAETTPDLESRINAIRGGGQPLAESERAFFEPRFGHDFSHVRVHTDAQAAETARVVNARAFTVGKDVVFGAGEYAPGTSKGQILLAHELSHTVQQKTTSSADSFSGTIYRSPETKNSPLVPKMEVRLSGEVIQVIVLGQTLAILKRPDGESTSSRFPTIQDKMDENKRRYGLRIECPKGWTLSFIDSGIQAMNRMIPHWQGYLHGIIKGVEEPNDQHIFAYFGQKVPQVAPKTTQSTSKTAPEKPDSPSPDKSSSLPSEKSQTENEPDNADISSKVPETEGKNEENRTSITGSLTKDIPRPVTDKSNSKFTLTVNDPPLGKYYYFRWSIRDAKDNAYRMLSVDNNTEVWSYSHSKHTYINDPSLLAMLNKNAGLGCQVLVRVLETDSPEIPSFYYPITETNSRVFRINFDYLPTPNKEKIDNVFEHLQKEEWDVDDLAVKLSDSEMISIELNKRVSLITYIAKGYLVGDEDETSIIRLIATTPSQDTKELFNNLNADNGKLYKILEKVLDGENYRKYHQVLRSKFSETMEPEEALTRASNALVLPWASPGVIHSYWNRRFSYEDVSINDSGKIHLEYWVTSGLTLGMGPKFHVPKDLDPNELIGVHFYFEEEEVGAPKGKTIYMPAINFLSLYNKQFRQNLKLVGDIALLGLGGMGIVGAATKLGKLVAVLELAFGVTDVVINEFRSDIAETEAGRNFLKAWDTVSFVVGAYGIARVALKLPQVFKGLKNAYIEFKESKPNLKPNDLKKVEDSINDVLKKAEDTVDEAKKTAQAGTEAKGATSGGKESTSEGFKPPASEAKTPAPKPDPKSAAETLNVQEPAKISTPGKGSEVPPDLVPSKAPKDATSHIAKQVEPSKAENIQNTAKAEVEAKVKTETKAKTEIETKAKTETELKIEAELEAKVKKIQPLEQQLSQNLRRQAELEKTIKKEHELRVELYKRYQKATNSQEAEEMLQKSREANKRREDLVDQLEDLKADERSLRQDIGKVNKQIGDLKKELDSLHIGPGPGEPHGGAYKDVPTAGGERHHIPADSISPLSTDKGPVIWMEVEDHTKTKSWGFSKSAIDYRNKQRKLIDQGKFREAVQMDIDDIRQKFGSKYDKGIEEMLKYLDSLKL